MDIKFTIYFSVLHSAAAFFKQEAKVYLSVGLTSLNQKLMIRDQDTKIRQEACVRVKVYARDGGEKHGREKGMFL